MIKNLKKVNQSDPNKKPLINMDRLMDFCRKYRRIFWDLQVFPGLKIFSPEKDRCTIAGSPTNLILH